MLNPGQVCNATSEKIDKPFISFVASPNGFKLKNDRTGPGTLSVMLIVLMKVVINYLILILILIKIRALYCS